MTVPLLTVPSVRSNAAAPEGSAVSVSSDEVAAASPSCSSPAVPTAVDIAASTSSRLAPITPRRPPFDDGKPGRRIPTKASTTAQTASTPPAR